MPITALYAALLAALFLALSMRVIALRRSRRIALGDGEDKELLRRMRVYANFAEYVPFALLLMALAESLATPALLLHLLGLTLLGARLIHAYGLSQTPQILQLRVLGMLLTFAVIAFAALACLALALERAV